MSTKQKKSLQLMLESLIRGNSDAAADYLHEYLQSKARNLVLGESKDEDECEDEDEKDTDSEDEDEDDDEPKSKSKKKDEDEDEDEDDADDEDEDKDNKKSKKKVEEGHNNFYKTVPHKSNETKAKAGLPKHPTSDDKIKGDVYKNKGKRGNETGGKKAKTLPGQKNKVKHWDDGREFPMGTKIK